jgi:hypothetical protein
LSPVEAAEAAGTIAVRPKVETIVAITTTNVNNFFIVIFIFR